VYDILSKEYTCCQGLVTIDSDLDPVQCRYHSNAIRKDMFPLLIALEKDLGTHRWISDITESHIIAGHTRIIQASPHCLSQVVNSLAQEAGRHSATGYISAAGRVSAARGSEKGIG
jgi:hypothetical protein